eukprot:332986-Pelagomonas_calceolata.AAC.5
MSAVTGTSNKLLGWTHQKALEQAAHHLPIVWCCTTTCMPRAHSQPDWIGLFQILLTVCRELST